MAAGFGQGASGIESSGGREEYGRLISTTTTWREELIRANFISFDADAIMAILLCTRVIDDFWAWEAERSRRFTVRSAYRMVMNKNSIERTG